ncbi:hypothetical protein ACJRO7_032839 [Eucalyptus globulus]|uniref:Pre-rRNA-processing protein TSR2 n=1 Tax=Eucalyptus globulus TaxID=34317 RepID=A0ABD3JM65_EUCGL
MAARTARLGSRNSAFPLRRAALAALYKPSADPLQRRERERQRDMETEPPTPPPRQLPEPAVPIFREGVALTLSRWSALQMAVDNEWGGRNSRQRADELGHDIFTWFTQSKGNDTAPITPEVFRIVRSAFRFAERCNFFFLFLIRLEPLYIDDLEDRLYEAMIALNTVAEDGSVEEVAEKLVIMHEECLEGNFAAVEKLREAALKRVAPAHVKQVVEGEEEEDSDSDSEDMTVDDSPYMVVDAPKSQPSPTPANKARDEGRSTQAAVDADGWTVVSSRKSKGKK